MNDFVFSPPSGRKPVICVVGYAGSGKDTIADILVRRTQFVKISLADPLKRFCADVFEFSFEQLWGPSEARNAPDLRYVRVASPPEVVNEALVHLTPRHALQQLGTEWGRACCPDIWIRYAQRMIEQVQNGLRYDCERGCYSPPAFWSGGPLGIVIPDVRFANEAAFFRSHGAFVLRVQRPGVQKGTHASELEQGSIEVDATVLNDGTIAELEEKIYDIVRTAQGRVL